MNIMFCSYNKVKINYNRNPTSFENFILYILNTVNYLHYIYIILCTNHSLIKFFKINILKFYKLSFPQYSSLDSYCMFSYC